MNATTAILSYCIVHAPKQVLIVMVYWYDTLWFNALNSTAAKLLDLSSRSIITVKLQLFFSVSFQWLTLTGLLDFYAQLILSEAWSPSHDTYNPNAS